MTGGSDDGIRIFIDGVAVIDDWVDRGFTSRTIETGPLSAGNHEIRVDYYENGGDALDLLPRSSPRSDRSARIRACRGRRRTSPTSRCRAIR